MSTTAAPYRASWVDWLIDWIDALPGPAWVPYAIASVVAGLSVNAAAWIDGIVRPPGTVDLYLSSLAIYFIASVAMIHFLDRRATQAWTTFRPAVSLSDDGAAGVLFELTALPARPALGWTTGGIAVAIITTIGGLREGLDIGGAPVTFLVVVSLATFAYASGGVLIYHTFRQLRLIGRLPEYIDQVNILEVGPLHAFSSVTAITGCFFLVAAYFSVLVDPTTFTNPAVAAVNAFAVVLAVACFVLPLNRMRQRIGAEKDRRLMAASKRLDMSLRDLARRNDTGDLSDADAVNKNINSLLAERDVLARTPTWPWSPETLRGFSTALLLPIALWLVFRILEGILA